MRSSGRKNHDDTGAIRRGIESFDEFLPVE